MTPEFLADDAKRAIERGTKMVLMLWSPDNMPPTFPPAQELWVNTYSNRTCYAYEPSEVLKWLEENRLIQASSQDTKIYELRVAGPDDVIVFNDELKALKMANEINNQYLQDRAQHPNQEVLCVATVHEVELQEKD